MDQIRLTTELLTGSTGLGQDIRGIQFAIDLVHPENPVANSVLDVRLHREKTDDYKREKGGTILRGTIPREPGTPRGKSPSATPTQGR